jgi:hypothetical protein
MWRTTILAAGLAVAVGSIAPDTAAAQGRGKSEQAKAAQARGQSKGEAKASERFEDRDRRGTDSRDSRGIDRRIQEERRIAEQRRYEERRLEERRRLEEQRRWDDQRRRSNDVYWPSDRDHDDRYYDRDSRNGPSFCRSGAGHPVQGRSWCIRKGYGLGTRDRWDRWDRDDIVFGRRDRRYDDRSLGRSVLGDILGRVVLGSLDTQARYIGGGTLNGRWLDDRSGPRILQVYAGRIPLAEFVDMNRDGRSDFIMINRGTR